MEFSGDIPPNLSSTDGVLVNSVNAGGAQGVGIQILDNQKKAIGFDKKYTIGSLAMPETSYLINSRYIARYYRYGETITSGHVEAKMIFNIDYD